MKLVFYVAAQPSVNDFRSAAASAVTALLAFVRHRCRTFLLANFPIRSIIQKVEYIA